MTNDSNILALDFGEARIGLALASKEARLAHPIGVLPNDDSLMEKLNKLCQKEGVSRIVVGLPRGLNGQETNQTVVSRTFGANLANYLKLPISWQDEAVTSAQAEAELKAKNKDYQKADIDALAATYILEDFLRDEV
jgi:putative Holliday junction resolvase